MEAYSASIVDLAKTYARTAGQAYGDAASYLRTLQEADWDGPTGAREWNVRVLAGHIVGEAVWFPNLVCGITRGDEPLPQERYEELKRLPGAELVGTLENAALELPTAVEAASAEQLEQDVNVGFAHMPLWQATYLPLFESVYYDWDLHAGRDPGASIPTAWAQTLATRAVEFAPAIMHQDAARQAPGRFLLQVSDDVGPITVTIEGGRGSIERGANGAPDVTIWLTADQYVRLLAGRFDIAAALDASRLRVEGDRDRAKWLNRLFAGVG
jgi:putative sterol carrier protein